jgi:hypothetical protein
MKPTGNSWATRWQLSSSKSFNLVSLGHFPTSNRSLGFAPIELSPGTFPSSTRPSSPIKIAHHSQYIRPTSIVEHPIKVASCSVFCSLSCRTIVDSSRYGLCSGVHAMPLGDSIHKIACILKVVRQDRTLGAIKHLLPHFGCYLPVRTGSAIQR